MLKTLQSVAQLVTGTIRDLAPIVLVVAFFQIAVLQQPFPNLEATLVGLVLVLLGLSLFLKGLELALFPVGEALAVAFARKGSVFWLLVFAFGLGFGTTVAEPALIAVGEEAARIMSEVGFIGSSEDDREGYALVIRYTVAASVGTALVIGVLRIIKGWPMHWLIIGGYVVVVLLTPLAPEEIIGIAYDSGGVTTSTITVPLVTALGVGLATSIRGRSPLIDGFGLIAFASLMPIIFVLTLGILT